MKTDLFARTMLVLIALLLVCNLFKNWNLMPAAHANSQYTVETISTSGNPGSFSAQGQIIAIACSTVRCFAIEK